MPGRRRAPGAVRRLPDGFSRLGVTWAAKSVAVVGVVGGAALALALPVDASPAALSLPVAATAAAQGRTDAFTASRSQGRAPAVAAPAVSAPADAAPVAPEEVGVAGVKAVAKPKPKPVATQAAAGSSSSSSSSSAAKVNVSSGDVSAKCSRIGLSSNAARLCTAVQKTFGISNIGGYRAGDSGDHGSGRAVDVMVTGARGDAVAAFVMANVGAYNVKYIIWEQRYWEPGGSWRLMEDRGGVTANHYDHVHVSLN